MQRTPCHGDLFKKCPLFSIAGRRMYKNRIQETEDHAIYDLRLSIYDLFVLSRVICDIRGFNLMLFEKTKPILKWANRLKPLFERIL
jgi:hypothetical protein